jgi:predicted metal-binding protein
MADMSDKSERPIEPAAPSSGGVAGELLDLARYLGASEAAIIDSAEIVLKDSLAALCVEPRCPNYGLAASCPPHVSGPAGFRELVGQHPHALVYKIDVDSELLLSPEVADLMRLIHEIGTSVERRARDLGYARASAFGGGSCKNLFCGEEPDCRVVDRGGDCRHPDLARPSMSGFGVDTTALLRSAGQILRRVDPGAEPSTDAIGTVCGVVLLGVL